MSHNSNAAAREDWFASEMRRAAEREKAFRAAQAESQPDLSFHLTGSQQKTAYALEKNLERMIAEHGLERVGFLTLTVGDYAEGRPFAQVWGAAEASRRINSLLTGLLCGIFGRMVIVTERHKSGAIHFHLLVECAEDIRTGFNWAEVTAGNYGSASPYLRGLWEMLRERLPGYGFGRSELTPIKTCGEAVARYVSRYVEKNLFARMKEDRGKRLVRYSGWKKMQMKANEFSWVTPAATEWRLNAREMARVVGVERREDVAKAFGPRWAWRLSRAMGVGDVILAMEIPRWEQRMMLGAAVVEECIYPAWKWWEQREEMDDEEEAMLESSTEEPSIETQMGMFPERYAA